MECRKETLSPQCRQHLAPFLIHSGCKNVYCLLKCQHIFKGYSKLFKNINRYTYCKGMLENTDPLKQQKQWERTEPAWVPRVLMCVCLCATPTQSINKSVADRDLICPESIPAWRLHPQHSPHRYLSLSVGPIWSDGHHHTHTRTHTQPFIRNSNSQTLVSCRLLSQLFE